MEKGGPCAFELGKQQAYGSGEMMQMTTPRSGKSMAAVSRKGLSGAPETVCAALIRWSQSQSQSQRGRVSACVAVRDEEVGFAGCQWP